jgi:soluble lytic murein transglycosylase-like protein
MQPRDLKTCFHRGAEIVTRAARTGFAAFGALALAFLVLDGVRFVPSHAAHASAFIPGMIAAEGVPASQSPAAAAIAAARDPRQRALADHLARRFRVAGDALDELVREAHAAGAASGLDPLLILAVIAVESRFNPIAESDYGAKGLMQVVPRFHLDKLAAHGGEEAVLEPRVNIRVGAQILREYIRQAGSLEEGLQLYAGAADDPGQSYAQKIATERRRLVDVVARVPKPATDA